MTDKGIVVEGLEHCKKSYCHRCPYVCDGLCGANCTADLASDALELLKEQEANKPKIGHWIFESRHYEAWSYTCSECGKRTTTKVNEFANWCWNCGAKMGGEAE